MRIRSDHIRRLMHNRGWSLEQLAAEAGVSRSTLRAWGINPPKAQPAKVKKVADALGVEVAELDFDADNDCNAGAA